MAAAGMRVLAIAEATAERPLPETPRGFSFTMLGLAGLADPLRRSVPAAIRECQQAGVRVVMITGDSPVTARASAHQAGLQADAVLDGAAIEAAVSLTVAGVGWRSHAHSLPRPRTADQSELP